MAKDQQRFKRSEKKYRIDERQYRALLSLIGDKVEYDQYGKYKICNLYFDTLDYQLIRDSLEKPIYKEKLRLRSYGTPTAESKVFLEIKKKYKGTVYKRRISLPYGEAFDYCLGRRKLSGEGVQGQIAGEIDWMMKRYQLYPMVYLSYDRMALRAMEDPELRITFDTNIRWRRERLDLAEGDFGYVKLPEGQYIMEIKIAGAMPLWLCDALDQLQIYPASYSKYGTVYREELMFERGELRYAQ
jgi:SPX domain protein involved in polyphosphate accumulation